MMGRVYIAGTGADTAGSLGGAVGHHDSVCKGELKHGYPIWCTEDNNASRRS